MRIWDIHTYNTSQLSALLAFSGPDRLLFAFCTGRIPFYNHPFGEPRKCFIAFVLRTSSLRCDGLTECKVSFVVGQLQKQGPCATSPPVSWQPTTAERPPELIDLSSRICSLFCLRYLVNSSPYISRNAPCVPLSHQTWGSISTSTRVKQY